MNVTALARVDPRVVQHLRDEAEQVALACVGARERRFCRYHWVLSRAAWSPRAAGRLLLGRLVRASVPIGPVLVGLDDTIERRRGAKIRATGIYRDPTRSSRSHFVKAMGLRWLSVLLLARIPWARRVWALPFRTALAPSARYSAAHRQRHESLLVWAHAHCRGRLQLRRDGAARRAPV